MDKILVSACLLGSRVRYNGSALSITQSDYDWLSSTFQIVTFCPEVSAGLPTPRPPAEITLGSGDTVLKGNAQVVADNGVDVTSAFLQGAQLALEKCLENNIKLAILTEDSPSCGSSRIYDGQFKGIKKVGMGVTSALLSEHSISIYNQHSISQLRRNYETDY